MQNGLAARPPLAGLYAITPDTVDSSWLLARVEAVLEGGARLVQYRNKMNDDTLRYEQAFGVQQLCRSYGAWFIVNDDVALAERLGADGVHLGRGDMPVEQARSRLGHRAIIGATCHGRADWAQQAMAAGADYVGIGAVFRSSTKPDTLAAPLELCASLARTGIPVAAIGGITQHNAAEIWQSGAAMLAMSAGVFASQCPAYSARAIIAARQRSYERTPLLR